MKTEQAITEITAACGHPVRAAVSVDIQQAMTEIEQLASQPCMQCRSRRQSLRHLCWGDSR